MPRNESSRNPIVFVIDDDELANLLVASRGCQTSGINALFQDFIGHGLFFESPYRPSFYSSFVNIHRNASS